ncbi:hypothetical protein Zm00014a_033957 [Zea mays]|uniref:AIR carboxylase n=1 Tax=Zea mays TaxID=4577 RepID=A0A3L6G5M1_MAIZE|nr:hypothetical protein Zm00014a_033957 [Zea mays]
MDAEDMEDVQAPTAVQVVKPVDSFSINQKYFKTCPRKQKSYNEPPLQAKEQYCSYPYKALNNYSMYPTVRPRVAIIMGSQSDLPVMKVVERVSKEFNIPCEDVEILRRV